ncbi:hypothetical protein [Methylobacterium oryzisoli]|uniref:hypothetical protein n=1 Tax=Methylobacterium oryzisoli TaxID=3385502 RepID=UPI003892C407
MTLLLAQLWPAALAALLLGLAVGWWFGWPGDRAAHAAAVLIAAGALVLAAVAAGEVVPGEPGLWVETAALLLVPYAIGCLAGAVLRRRGPAPDAPTPTDRAG